jgi:hypothetical protein
MEKFDQQVTAAGRLAEQIPHLFESRKIDLPALRGPARTPLSHR